ncbi:MAG TPA: phenylacetate-CoA oxygenase subunit PaaC, partial [Hyphomicrobiaceae bacterium]|nr:phenylacetate-CoA oxygenase subunit PaaC [Hyphomicrobiaceae bacterium]
EEDIALSNMGLDLIGQARLFYTLAGEVEGQGRDEDRLAYFRDAPEFRNVLLVELPNGDFARTMARHLVYASFAHPFMSALAGSNEARLAEIAAKAEKELAYHVRHASEWVIRLGDGTDESRGRMIAGLEFVWGYGAELETMDALERELALAGVAVDRAPISARWTATIAGVLAEAGLEWPKDRFPQSGGRSGRHTEHLGHLLAVMQSTARADPEAIW